MLLDVLVCLVSYKGWDPDTLPATASEDGILAIIRLDGSAQPSSPDAPPSLPSGGVIRLQLLTGLQLPQRAPLKDAVLHVDVAGVALEQPVTVPILHIFLFLVPLLLLLLCVCRVS